VSDICMYVNVCWNIHCILLFANVDILDTEMILVLGSQPAGDRSHKPGGRLP